jgi:hypothetical protein
MQTSEQTLKQLSEAIDAYASAKVANNESLIRFSISNLQQFLNGHHIIPATVEPLPEGDGPGEEGVQ